MPKPVRPVCPDSTPKPIFSLAKPARKVSETGQAGFTQNMQWLQSRVEDYRSDKNDMCEAIENFEELDKLGQGFTSADPLEEVDIGDGPTPRPTFVNKNLQADYKAKLIELLKEYVDCFAWSYSEMPCLSRKLAETGFRSRMGLGYTSNWRGDSTKRSMTASRRW